MLSALLVDDEPEASTRLRELLAAHPEIEVVAAAKRLAEARAILETRPPDVMFLDVEMPGGSGLDLLASVPSSTQVVFVTAHEKYAVRAFAASALDYLVKPVDPERLADTVARFRRQVLSGHTGPHGEHQSDDQDQSAETASGGHVLGVEDSVSVPQADKTITTVVNVGDICWIEALRNYTRVARKWPAGVTVFRRRLSSWDTILPVGPFARVGRSYLIQLATVAEVEWLSRDETRVTFVSGAEPLMLGRVPAERLREILSGEA